jgi:uncharacterized membrane protein YfcA
MPLLIQILGPQQAAPLGALIAITNQIILTTRFRHAFNLRAVAPLSVAAIIGIPFGVTLLKQVDSRALLLVLGMVIVGYALYALLNLRLLPIRHPGWAYGFGFAAGILSGAYNTGGPPIVIYATCKGWPPQEFKANLQGMFLLNSITVIVTHLLNQEYTASIVQTYVTTLPFLALGLLAGLYADRFIQPTIFRRVVLWLLLVIGLNLVF